LSSDGDGKSGQLSSAIYSGLLTHRRTGPGLAHSFSYQVALPLLYLDELEAAMRLHRLWSARWPAPVHFRRGDFLGPADMTLDQAVRDLVDKHSQGVATKASGPADAAPGRPADAAPGRIALLANLRTWGWLFNPISLYFCFTSASPTPNFAQSERSSVVQHLVAEVENTPWHERTQYVVGGPGQYRLAKQMHVSPFLPMELDYELEYSAPAEKFHLRIDVLKDGVPLLKTGLALRRQVLDRRQMGLYLRELPPTAHKVSLGIYAQAAVLGLKGARFFAHPRQSSRTGAGAR